MSLVPPLLTPISELGPFALFSKTSIALKNGDHIYTGDVFANDSVLVEQNAILNGSVTSAKSWIQTQNGSDITGNLWSGGFNTAGGWALDLAGTVTGWAKASVTAPADPATCAGENHANYNVHAGSVSGNVTTLGQVTSGTYGSKTEDKCTIAAAAQDMPIFDESLYPLTLPAFASASAFNTWLSGQTAPIHGNYKINESTPDQYTHRVDLSGMPINGDTAIITNAPIYFDSLNDNALPSGSKAKLFLVSHYPTPDATGCDVNHDHSDCAIHAKNDFTPSCKTAALLFADQGVAAIKNNSDFCGAVYSAGILIKNNLTMYHDSRFDRPPGISFGPIKWEPGQWQELPVS